jgi:DNA-binding SARP family transcriptional activator
VGEVRDVRLRLIGGFDLTIDGEPEPTLQPAMQRLLAFVALTPRGVERMFTALQLWPDTSEERAKANLRSTLWRLGKLPVVLVTTTKSRLRLADGVWVDARDGIDELVHGLAGGVLDAALPFQNLLADLLPDWYDDWLIIERERLRQLSLASLEARARSALEQGDTHDAIQLALSAMSIDLLRESAHRLLIEAHLAEGNDRDAHRALASYSERLAARGLGSPGELASIVDARAAVAYG